MVRRGTIRKIKTSQSYTYAELARLVGKCQATVRGWASMGLPVLKCSKPHLILGSEARTYLTQRFHATKPKMQIGEVRCFTCQRRRPLEDGLAEIVPHSGKGWRLQGLCAECGGMCSRLIADHEVALHARKLSLETATGFKPMPSANP